MFPWLTVLMVLPLVGAVLVAALPSRAAAAAPKQIALGISLITLVYAVVLAFNFDPAGGWQFDETHTWIASFGAHYALSVDGLGLAMVLLTAILSPIVILASWHDGDAGRWAPKGMFAWLLALEGLALGCFMAADLLLFYILFEAVLFPVYFLVAGYGGVNRRAASIKFLIYSLAGGLVMLAGVIGVYVETAKGEGKPSYLLSDLVEHDFTGTPARLIFVALFIAFAIKAPLFPVHTWLPDTTEAGTAGTNTMLVSVLDKLGSFAMIRFCLEIFPEASKWATPVVIALALISILYGALMAIGSHDMNRLIAYTSVSHFGFIVLGIFVMNSQGLTGANIYMFAHGLSTAAIFLTVGYLVRRRGTAQIGAFGGLDNTAPVLSGFFLVACLSLLSLPGLLPFVSEFLVFVGAWREAWWYAAIAAPGIVLAAVYALWMYQRTMTGPPRPELAAVKDLDVREIAALAPVVVLLVVFGFFPKPITSLVEPAAETTMSHVGAHDPAPAVGSDAQHEEGSAQ